MGARLPLCSCISKACGFKPTPNLHVFVAKAEFVCSGTLLNNARDAIHAGIVRQTQPNHIAFPHSTTCVELSGQHNVDSSAS
jgi:hypothetical protein